MVPTLQEPVGGQHERSEVVAALQYSLLPPSLPALPGVTIEARYRAGSAEHLGGDWYDAIAMPDGRLLLTIGDVVGHGSRAAAAMGMLRSALHVYAMEGFSPRAMLERLNRFTLDPGRGDVATVLVLLLEPASGCFEVATAGHPPPAIRAADGSVSFLSAASGPPVRATPRARYVQQDGVIAAGETLVLYTDGLIERRGEDLDMGMARLADAIASGPPTTSALAEHLMSSPVAIAPEDDIALLVLQTDPHAMPLHMTFPAQPRELRAMRNALTQWMQRAGIAESEATNLLLAVHEAVANATEHAYGVSDGDVRVDVEIHDSTVDVAVHDDGHWREPRVADGGRGLELIRRLVDDVGIVSGADGTTVRMRAGLGDRPAAPN